MGRNSLPTVLAYACGGRMWATLESVDWFDNHRRFLEPIGNILPVKVEAEYLFLSRRSAMSVGL